LFNDSNWSDKKTPLWFIMLPTGHEGPYSLETLESRLADNKLREDVQVWREGLPVAISLRDVLSEIEVSSDDLPPPLPPLPEDDLPEIPFEEEELSAVPTPGRSKTPLIVAGLIAVVLIFGVYQWMSDQEKFEIRRYPKMSLEIHKKIMSEQKFEGFDKKIFFHEYASPDLTHLWLVTTGYQRCDVEATFRSVKDRLLTMDDEEVELITRGKLANHVAEFNVFEFRKGVRIIPGLYEMDVKAQRCEWDGIVPRIRNLFSPPEAQYEATTRVVLYPGGPEEFQKVLSQLMKKKEELRKQNEGQEQLFWEDLQMKFQTLHAMALQIEQHFLDFLDKGDRDFVSRRKIMIAQYTKKYGNALTEFVIANEGYFEGLRETDLRPLLVKKNYEGIVRSASKSVGMESMKVIEKLQKMKKPSPAEIKALRSQVLKSFEQLKNSLTKLLLEMTADRST
jgi:hypothetical protein